MSRLIRLLAIGAVGAGLVVPGTASAAVVPLQVGGPAALASPYVMVRFPSTQLKATGGTKPYSWTVVAGALPYGIKLSASGVLSGTSGVPGAHDFTVRVTDKTHGTADRAYEIYVKPMEITTASLKAGSKGKYYFGTKLKSLGGCGSPKWSTNFPNGGFGNNDGTGVVQTGLRLSPGGVISGVPKVAGTVSFTVMAACPGNIFTADAAFKAFTLTVTP